MKPQNVLFFFVLCVLLHGSEELEDEISNLWKAFREMMKELDETKNKLTATTDELTETQNELTETKKELRILKERFDVKDVLNKRDIPSANETQSLEQDILTMKAQIQSLTVPKVGFTAILRNHASNLGDNQVIVFDQVLTNEGSSYNSLMGTFTCRVPGLYLFYVHTLTFPGHYAETVLMKNSQNMAILLATDKEDYASGSNMAIVNLNIGDTVYLRTHGHNHDSIGLIFDAAFTSFSGVLIHT